MITDAKILIVDDYKTNRLILAKHLNNLGISNIIEAENGQVALEILSDNQVDLVLLDIMMPKVDGYEVLKHIKSNKNLRQIPVIMITAIDDLDSTVKCIELGAEDYLLKPFNKVLLRARINASLQRKYLEDIERQYLRFNDFITGLPNRDFFLKHLHDELLNSKRHQSLFSILLVRLNNYTKLLDGLGQRAGDEFIVAQGKRLEKLLPDRSILARLEHNEFALILNDIDHAAEGSALAQQIQIKLEEPLKIKERNISGGVSIGLTFSSAGYDRPEDMLRDAGLAAGRAVEGEGYQIFDELMHKKAVERLDLETELKKAIEEKQFVLFYQPIAMLTMGEIVGFEALIRWRHPDKGMVPPDDFIPLSEETGLVVPMGSWVLEEACRQATEWNNLLGHERRIIVGVNVSAQQLREENFLDILNNALVNTQLKGPSLKLELTETALIDNPDQVYHMLSEVRKLDIKIAIDDFGTGYSSLSYLHRFPINTVKIDQSFIKNIEVQSKNYKIVQSTIELAHKLGMDVIAEGIEDDKVADSLREMHCEYGQGWFFHRPLPAEDATKLLFLP